MGFLVDAWFVMFSPFAHYSSCTHDALTALFFWKLPPAFVDHVSIVGMTLLVTSDCTSLFSITSYSLIKICSKYVGCS